MNKVMVKLNDGYGDGYGVVMVDDAGEIQVEPGSHATHYSDHGVRTEQRIEEWKRKILAQKSVILVDGGVKVPVGAVARVIGPLDCPEAIRIRAKRYLRNAGRAADALIAVATDAELAHAFATDTEQATWERFGDLWRRYPTAAAATK